MRAYLRHFVKPNGQPMCADLRTVFERRGLDFDDMVHNGIEFNQLRKIKHPSVARVIEKAQKDG